MAIVDLLGRPIAYHRIYRTITGSTVAAVFISQLTYWQRIVDNGGGGIDGWIYKTIAECEKETGLSRSEQSTARKVLGDKKIIREKKSGMPRKLYYCVNWQVLEELLQQYHLSVGSRIHECKDQAGMCGRGRQATYSSTETTHDTTTMVGGGKDIDKYIGAAIDVAQPKDPVAYRVALKQRLRNQNGLNALDKEQLESWTTVVDPVVIAVGDSINWKGGTYLVTAVFESNIELQGAGIQPLGLVYAALKDGTATLTKVGQ